MPQTCGGAAREGPPLDDEEAAKPTTSPRLASTITGAVDELAARRELHAWIEAARHLNNPGYAAAVPAELVGPLRCRGLAVWAAAGRRAA
jgi:hypothetical protein